MSVLNRLIAFWIVAVLIAVGVIANLILSNRPMSGYSMLQIEEIATLPDTPELADVRRYTEIGSGFIPHMRGVRTDVDIASQPLKIGWVYQEGGIMSLPYWAQDVSTGPSLYIDTGRGYQIAGVTPAQTPLLEQKVGRPIVSTYSFQWYKHIWGWAFPISLILLIWLWRREMLAREEAAWRREVEADAATSEA